MTEMNREQRRARKNGAPAVAAVPAPTGPVHRQLSEPRLVGEITASEANEIRAVNALIKQLDEDLEKSRRTRVAVGQYRQSVILKTITDRGLDAVHAYNVNDETGQILLTHELVTPEPGVLELVPPPSPPEPEAVPEAAKE